MAKARIMVVEDEDIVASDIRRTLEDLGYGVCATAASGEAALRTAAEEKPDLVLMDIMLKGEVDGIEAAGRMCLLDIPVLYLTAHAAEDVLERAKATGPYGYIIKPFEDRQLETAIEVALCRHKIERGLKKKQDTPGGGSLVFLEGIPDLMFRLNQEGTLVDFHAPSNCPTQVPLGEFLGKTMYRLMEVPALKESIEEVLLTGNTRSLEYRLELGGQERIFEARISRCSTKEVLAMVSDITERKQREEHREKSVRELEDRLERARKLSGLFPICASCKKIRNPRGLWEPVESHIQKHTEIRFTHSICPECRKKLSEED